MKKLKIFTIIGFLIILLIPVVTFDFRENAVSEIDNRQLAENPFKIWKKCKSEGKEINNLDSVYEYVKDRIGFRNQMILSYTWFNDKIFSEMVHPTYTYGKDGYVFFRMQNNIQYSGFHDSYVNMLINIQNYCNERNIPCYFLFEPSKVTVLEKYLPKGVKYDRSWVDLMLSNMEKAGVSIVDNTELLIDLEESGISVFNKKYDAGHWNDYGAYYGINHLLGRMKKDGLLVKENNIDEFSISEEKVSTLPVSEFPIDENIPVIDINNNDLVSYTEKYIDEIELDENFKFFCDIKNKKQKKSPKLLIFQGSYINGKGGKFLANAFGEYIGIHDYQNTINFDYYYNIFQPEVVVIEVAEYACSSGYFDIDKMNEMRLNPVLDVNMIDKKTEKHNGGLIINEGNALTTISWTKESYKDCLNQKLENFAPYVWLMVNGKAYDMRRSLNPEYAYECTIDKRNYRKGDKIQIIYGNEIYKEQLTIPILN